MLAKVDSSSPWCGITSNGKLHSRWITVQADAEHSEQDRKVIADAIDILLHVNEFVERRDAITGQEVVVRGCIDSGASCSTLASMSAVRTFKHSRSSNVSCGIRCLPVMSGVTCVQYES